MRQREVSAGGSRDSIGTLGRRQSWRRPFTSILLIGDDPVKPLVSLSPPRKRELDERIARRELTPEGSICLRLRCNDPEVSFLTTLADVPHGHAMSRGEEGPATLYVAEPRDLDTEITPFGDYALTIGGQ